MMKSVLLLQVVLLWAAASANDDDEQPEYMKPLEDTEYDECYDLRTILSPDHMYCQLCCSFDCQCQHYSYKDASFSCAMKHVEHGVTPIAKPKEGSVSGCAIPPEEMDNYQCYEHTFEEMDFPGNDIMVLRKKSPEECSETCTRFEDCEFYSYNIKTNMCHLKSCTMLASPPNIEVLHGVISGYTMKNCEPEDMCGDDCRELTVEGMEFPGKEIARMLQPDPDRCQLVCNDLPKCICYTYIHETHPDKSMRFLCILKTHDPNANGTMVEKPHHCSGYSLRIVRYHKTCSDEVYWDMNFPGHDQKMVRVATYEDCRRACSADALCQYWSHCTTEYPDKKNHYACYMKNVMALPVPPAIENNDDMVSGFSQKNCMDDDSSEEITQYDQQVKRH